jgi:hypothetical protein
MAPRAGRATLGFHGKPRAVTFHFLPLPKWGTGTVMVMERGQPGGEFILSLDAMERVRRCLTPGSGVRIVDHPP